MRKLIISTLLLSSILIANQSIAENIPKRIATDRHIKVVMHDQNNVVTLKSRYGYQTQIAFGLNETVQSVSIGDSLAWQAVPVSNNLFIKPVAQSKTNMTVLTNVNNYNFELDSLDLNVMPTYKLQFLYLSGGYNSTGQSNAIASLDPAKLNWKYSFTGDRDLAPTEAFDNGRFTYFKFKTDGMSHLPSVFIVDKKRNETLINYHMQGDYMVINSVAKQFTLRDGAYVTCVYNDYAIGDWRNVK